MNMTQVIVQLKREAEEAGLTVEKYAGAIEVRAKHDAEEQATRRSTDAEREKITGYLNSLNGKISVDTPISDIIAGAGVRKIQGTSSFARQELKRLLLTHQPK